MTSFLLYGGVALCAAVLVVLGVLIWALETPLDPERRPPRSYPE